MYKVCVCACSERDIQNALSSWPTYQTTSSSNPGAIENPRFDKEHYKGYNSSSKLIKDAPILQVFNYYNKDEYLTVT